MLQPRIVDLDAARRCLFGVSEELTATGRPLQASGLAEDERAASRMGTGIKAMLKRVRTAHSAAVGAERSREPSGDTR
jgi:hypothetical protein